MPRSPSYFLAINQAVSSGPGGVPVWTGVDLRPCEQLGIDPVVIRRASLDVDVLEMEQHRVRGAWAVTLTHGTSVRLVRRDPDTGELRQMFAGRVDSPMETRDAARRRRVIRVHNVMQLAKESLFTRGRWVTHFLPLPTLPRTGFYGTTPLNEANGHECTLFTGYNFFTATRGRYNGFRVARVVRQSVRRALDEWSFNFAALAVRHASRVSLGPAEPGGPTIPAQASQVWAAQGRVIDLGTPIWPDNGQVVSLNYLDWLIRITQPMPNAFSAVLYDKVWPEVVVGRFDKVSAVELELSGGPSLSQHVAREVSEEAAGVHIISQGEGVPFRGRSPGVQFPLRPPSPQLYLIDPRNVPIDASVGGDLGITAAQAVADIGPLFTAQRWQGNVTLSDRAWDWCKPGSVLSLGGGARMHVQETSLDLATEALSVSVGLPRHIGQRDFADVLAWVRGNFGTEATA